MAVISRESPFEILPTTIMGLFDDSIEFSDIDNLFPYASKRAFAYLREAA